MTKTLRITLIILGLATGGFFLVKGLMATDGFFAPIVSALILAIALLPFSRWLERFMKRVWAAGLSTIAVLIVSIGFLSILGFQIAVFVEDWPQIKTTMEPKVEAAKDFIVANSPLTQEDLRIELFNSDKTSSVPVEPLKITQSAVSKIFGFSGNYLLMLIYIFFILRYRTKFKNYLLSTFSDSNESTVLNILEKSSQKVPRYIQGKLILMGILAVIYSIGLGISGVSNYILVGIIAALLTLIPFLGNIIGFFLAVVLGYLTTGELSSLIGIAITFSATQLIESYVLQPYIIGDEVDIHPFFIIVVVIAGNLIWGIIGMIIAIPVLAIVTVVFLETESFRNLGILLSSYDFNSKKQE